LGVAGETSGVDSGVLGSSLVDLGVGSDFSACCFLGGDFSVEA